MELMRLVIVSGDCPLESLSMDTRDAMLSLSSLSVPSGTDRVPWRRMLGVVGVAGGVRAEVSFWSAIDPSAFCSKNAIALLAGVELTPWRVRACPCALSGGGDDEGVAWSSRASSECGTSDGERDREVARRGETAPIETKSTALALPLPSEKLLLEVGKS